MAFVIVFILTDGKNGCRPLSTFKCSSPIEYKLNVTGGSR